MNGDHNGPSRDVWVLNWKWTRNHNDNYETNDTTHTRLFLAKYCYFYSFHFVIDYMHALPLDHPFLELLIVALPSLPDFRFPRRLLQY